MRDELDRRQVLDPRRVAAGGGAPARGGSMCWRWSTALASRCREESVRRR